MYVSNTFPLWPRRFWGGGGGGVRVEVRELEERLVCMCDDVCTSMCVCRVMESCWFVKEVERVRWKEESTKRNKKYKKACEMFVCMYCVHIYTIFLCLAASQKYTQWKKFLQFALNTVGNRGRHCTMHTINIKDRLQINK